MTLNSSRQPFLLLRCALAISVVLAFPIEQVMHDSYLSISSCSNEEIGLNLGNIVQAILTPIFIFLLPGPGSIFQKKVASSSLRRLSPVGAPVIPRSAVSARRSAVPMAVFLLALGLAMFLASGWSLKHWIGQSPMTSSPFANAAVAALLIIQLASSLVSIGAAIFLLRLHVLSEGALFIAAGCLCAVMISIAWWYGVQEYAELHGECAALYDWSLPVHSFKPDYVSDFFHYFIYLSGFSALWVGVTAGGLRLQSARAAEGNSAGKPLRHFQGFYWACFLGWAVQYRISQCFAVNGHNQEWVLWAVLDFVFLTASSLWVLAFISSWWKKKPRTWLHAIMQAYWRSFAIVLLTALTFCWLFIGAVGTLKPFVTWNVFGLAWALGVGTWRWRALQKESLTAVVPQM